MRTHKCITITEKMLRDQGACIDGLEQARQFLPARISTDPEENLELAMDLADSARAIAQWEDARWFASVLDAESLGMYRPDNDYFFDQTDNRVDANNARDPMLIAQYLAWAADALLTRRGR